MAGVHLTVNSGEVSVAAATAKTVLQILAANNHRSLVRGISIYFKGIVVTDAPAKVRVLRQTTAGTMTGGTAGTHIAKRHDGDDETLQTAVSINASAEPTAGDVLECFEVHPQTGHRVFYPFDQPIHVKGGGRLGVEITAPQAQTCVVQAEIEE